MFDMRSSLNKQSDHLPSHAEAKVANIPLAQETAMLLNSGRCVYVQIRDSGFDSRQ